MVPNPITGKQEIVGASMRSNTQPSIDTRDVARAAMTDIENQKAAKAETRGIAEDAVADINQQYNESVSLLRQQLADQRAQVEATQDSASQKADDYYDFARQFAVQQNEETEERVQQVQTKIEEEVNNRRNDFKSTFGLQMSNIVEGMRGQYQDDLGVIDEAAAKGLVDPADVESMRAQAKQQYQNRLASVAAQVGTQYAQSRDAMLESTNRMLADVSKAMTQTEATMGANISQVLASMADGYAQYQLGREQQARLADAARMEQAIAIEQLAVQRPELAAEIKLGASYLPQAVMEYPIWKELYDMQQLATMDSGGGSYQMDIKYGGGLPEIMGPGSASYKKTASPRSNQRSGRSGGGQSGQNRGGQGAGIRGDASTIRPGNLTGRNIA
jgi:hypothetical protein